MLCGTAVQLLNIGGGGNVDGLKGSQSWERKGMELGGKNFCKTTESGRNRKEIKQHCTATVRSVKSLDKLCEAWLELILG